MAHSVERRTRLARRALSQHALDRPGRPPAPVAQQVALCHGAGARHRCRQTVFSQDFLTFSGRMARERGQDVTFVTERCVMRLLEDGLTVTEVAPGVNLERDILERVEIPLRVSPNVRQMDAKIFAPAPMGLQLARPVEPLARELVAQATGRTGENGRV